MKQVWIVFLSYIRFQITADERTDIDERMDIERVYL